MGRSDMTIPSAGKDAVRNHTESEDRGSTKSFSVQGHQTRYRGNEARKIGKEPMSIFHRFSVALEVKALEITEPSMDDPKAVGACMLPEIIPFQEQWVKASPGRLEREHGTADASADDHEIKRRFFCFQEIPDNGRHPPESFLPRRGENDSPSYSSREKSALRNEQCQPHAGILRG